MSVVCQQHAGVGDAGILLSNDLLEVNDGSDEKWIQTLRRCCRREMGDGSPRLPGLWESTFLF